MMADLTITERHHHSWPMHYVPIGRDATIATGYKDFKFVNSTEGELVIFAHLDKKAKTITVRLYGIHSDEFDHIKITSKRTGSLPAKGTKVHLDESLSAGSRVEERKERRGRTSVTYKEYYDALGKLIKKETAYEDSYPSIEVCDPRAPRRHPLYGEADRFLPGRTAVLRGLRRRRDHQ